MNNKFLRHFLVIGSGTFISMVTGFLTTSIITRIVSPTEYGQLSIFTVYSSMTLMVLYLGLDQSLVRFFYQKEMDQYRRELLFKYLKNPVIGKVVSGTVVLILSATSLVRLELGKVVLSLVCFYTFIQIMYRFSLSLVRLQYKSKLYSILGIVQKAVYVVLTTPFIKLNSFSDIMSLAVATVLAALTCMIINIVAERRLWNPGLLGKNECAITQGELIEYAYPYILPTGVTTLFQYIDRISLNYYRSYEEIGVYSLIMTLIHVFSITQTTFNTPWVSMAVGHYTNDKEDVSFYQKGNQVIIVVMFFIGFTLILCKDVFSVSLGAKYGEIACILPFLTFNPIMYTISETTVNGLVFEKKGNIQVVVSLGACIMDIIGNTILVPKLGYQGAAISTGFSYIVSSTLRTTSSSRCFYVDIHLKKFYFITVLAVMYMLYNTFAKFNIGSIVGYAVYAISLVLLYRTTVKCDVQYVVDMAVVFFRKKASK